MSFVLLFGVLNSGVLHQRVPQRGYAPAAHVYAKARRGPLRASIAVCTEKRARGSHFAPRSALLGQIGERDAPFDGGDVTSGGLYLTERGQLTGLRQSCEGGVRWSASGVCGVGKIDTIEPSGHP